MNRIYITLLGLLLFTTVAYAQQKLTGSITDARSGQPIAGASVTTGGKTGTLTAADGSFSLECNGPVTLVISHVGFETKRYPVKTCPAAVAISLNPTAATLDEVEVTATSNQNKKLLYQPVSLTKLNPVELKRNTGLFLDDAINTNVPGVTMSRRSVSGGQSLNIRGYGNGTRGTRGVSSNFDGQGYKVYLNGIAITDAEGITTFDDLDFASVGNVEVTKGPSGTLYGLAIAGAVNLSSVKPEKGSTSISQEVLTGSYGLQRYTTSVQTATDKASLLLNYGKQKSDGYSIHNSSRKDFVNAIGSFQLSDKESINTYIGYSNSYDERLGELTLDQWKNNDYSGNPEYLKRNAHSNVVTVRAGVSHVIAISKNVSNTTSVFGTGFTSNASSAAGWTDKWAVNGGLRSTLDIRIPLNSKFSLNGITGIETQRQDAQTIGYRMKKSPNDIYATWVYGTSPYFIIDSATSNVYNISRTTSLFTEWTLALPGDLSVTAGVGSSSLNLFLNDKYNPQLATRPNSYEKKYKNMVLPHFAINKVFSKQLSVYAAYSKGYKAPLSSYFFIAVPQVNTVPVTPATGRVNANLKPEVGTQIEIGTKGQLFGNKLTYELAYFNAVFDNKMTAVAVASPLNPNTTLYSVVVNGSKQKHKGAEALVKFTAYESSNGFVVNLRPFVNATFSDFTYGDNFTIQKSTTVTENYSGKKVAGVSPWVVNAGFDLNLKHGLYATASYNYRDKQPITGLNDFYAPGFNLLNGKLGFRHSIGSHVDVDLYAGGQNLTNTRYFIMVFANQLPDAYIPAPRHSQLFGGINLKYSF